ncbi:MAG: hypothetical protein GY870_02595 [archaeon]|nr:hypothetical protein [archaeon]
MKETQKNILTDLFIRSIEGIIDEKRKNPKNTKKLNKFNVKMNIGLQIEKESYLWLNLISDNGNVSSTKGQLEDSYDLVIKSVPEDLMFYCNGENSLFHMLLKKNKFGKMKLRFSKGTTGYNIRKLLQLPGIIVLDKVKPS